jgi:tetratricopeptide (TPR) repeat protein
MKILRAARPFCVLLILGFMFACAPPEQRAAEHLDKAQRLFESGDIVKAELEAKNAAQIEPKNAEARYLLAVIAEQNQRFREMVGNLQVAVDADPSMVQARVKLGTIYFFGRAYDQAAEQAAAAMAIAPDNANVRVLNARVKFEQEDRRAALAEVDEALSLAPLNLDAIALKASLLAPDDPDAALRVLDSGIAAMDPAESYGLRRIKLAILAQQNRTADVEQELVSLIDAVPDDQTYPVQLAKLYTTQGRVDEAEQVMRDLAAAASESVDAKLGLVEFLGQVRSPEAAEEALRIFVEDDPENQQLRLALGRYYEATGRGPEAVSVYEDVISLDAKSDQGLMARNRLVAQRLQADDPKGARHLIEEILIDAPDNPDALLVRAGLAFTEEEYDDAIADLRVVLRKNDKSERALLLLGRAHARAGDIVLAQDAYRRLLDVNPRHTDGSRELVGLALRAGNLEEAEGILRGLTEADPEDAVTGARLVELLVLQDAWEDAEIEARRIAATKDETGVGSFQLGRVLEARQRHEEATEAYLQALSKNPAAMQMLQGLARSLNAQGKAEESVAYLRGQVERYPDQLGARLLLGAALSGQGETDEARKLFESVIDDRPDSPAGYMATAGLYAENSSARIAVYRRGLGEMPGNPQLGMLLASEYERQGQYDEAIELYEELLAKDPNLAVAMNNLAALILDFRYDDPANVQRALEMAERLADSRSPAMTDTLGWAYYRAGETSKAVSYLERAVAAAGEAPVLRYHLGMAYLAADNPVGAKQELDKALQLAQSDFVGIEEARATLASLQDG